MDCTAEARWLHVTYFETQDWEHDLAQWTRERLGDTTQHLLPQTTVVVRRYCPMHATRMQEMDATDVALTEATYKFLG